MCLVIFTIRHTFFLHAFDSITNNRSTHIIIFRIKCAIFWHCSERNRIKCTGKKLCNYNARMTIEICHFSRVPFHWLRAFDAPSSKQIEPNSSWWGRRIAEQRGKNRFILGFATWNRHYHYPKRFCVFLYAFDANDERWNAIIWLQCKITYRLPASSYITFCKIFCEM